MCEGSRDVYEAWDGEEAGEADVGVYAVEDFFCGGCFVGGCVWVWGVEVVVDWVAVCAAETKGFGCDLRVGEFVGVGEVDECVADWTVVSF